MSRNTRLLFIVAIAAVMGVVALQFYWIRNYYQVNGERFEKEVNLAFEDAIKTELRLRCDTLEGLLYRFLLDTTQVTITSKWNDVQRVNEYIVRNVNGQKESHSFSMKLLNLPVVAGNDSVKRLVARDYAREYRDEDLERHIIFFHTQNLGAYMSDQAERYRFDTSRLRPVYARLLAQRGIRESFAFYMRDDDNTMNRNVFPDSLRRRYPVITKAFPTYRVYPGENYVRALFPSSTSYLYSKMTGIVVTSALLLFIVAYALYYFLRVIRQEKKLSAIKNDFISNISHELRTPIATVTAAVDALKGFGALEDPVRTARYLDISGSELQRLSDMVNRILYLSLYEKQEFDLKMEPVNIDSLIEEVMGSHSLKGEKKIVFGYVNDSGAGTVIADKLHLHNVLNNLVDNAVKYSGDEVSIHLRLHRDREYFMLDIRDDGIGIARADLPFIFDKFYRVPSGNIHRVKGYGLGLTYVRLVMQRQGGWCVVESSPGKGSIFQLGFKIGG
jgi:signal transduction histidine kinase